MRMLLAYVIRNTYGVTVKHRLHDTTCCQNGCIVYTAGCQTGLTTDVCLYDTAGCQTGCTTGLTTGCIVQTEYNSDVYSVLLASTITYTVAVHYKRHCIFYENVYSDATSSSKVLVKHW